MILVFNPGSSSVKYKLFENVGHTKEIAGGSVDDIGSGSCANYTDATRKLCGDVRKLHRPIDIIGYRVVHGGGLLENGSPATDKNLKILEEHSGLAPLHNPQAIDVIKACEPFFGRAKHLLFFDTDFFKNLPPEETNYPLPRKVANENNIKRFGFHGISHRFTQEFVDPKNLLNVITVHLGAGCSIAAISNGKPIATSLGFTPDEGLMMQTRSGDIDPGIILYLTDKYGKERAREIIEKESGLAGVTRTDGDMLNVLYLAKKKIEDPDFKPVISRTVDNKESAELALSLYVKSILKYIAYYSLLLKHVDILVFTGKIGYGSSVIRDMVTDKLQSLPIGEFTKVKPDEELAIAQEICQIKP